MDNKNIVYFDKDKMVEAAQFVAELCRQGIRFKSEMEGEVMRIEIFGY